MKRYLLIFLILVNFSAKSYTQIIFEKGYFIDNDSQKIECLIKNIDWKNNPIKFDYKISESQSSESIGIDSVLEFGIGDVSKYRRYTVEIDRSSELLNNLSIHRNPTFQKEQLFLKVLVEGDAILYGYEDGNLKRFFYQKRNEEEAPKQLVYKAYQNKGGYIGYNNQFRQQLWNHLKCEKISLKDIERLDYEKKDLIGLFVQYNGCSGEAAVVSYEPSKKRDIFDLTLRLGMAYSQLMVKSSIYGDYTSTVNFEDKITFRVGLQAEFYLPFNKNKWSVLTEPTFQCFISEGVIRDNVNKIHYQSIEVPIGLRHYFYLNHKNKLFLNGVFLVDFSNNSKIDRENAVDLEIKTRNNWAFGFGYKYRNKYSCEVRYQTNRELLSDYLYHSANYSTLSLMLGYTLF
ncbi:tRNA modification GTPase [Limibacter armeniacum]|uniref:tRNA modification GTPase n=1 Tax=Limibacter armeniacum TaxID=466084 RepID=UPI002FE67D14